MGQYFVILTTCSSAAEAESIGKILLKERFIACINIINGVFSFFHWDNKIDNAKEILVLMKTQKTHIKQVIKIIKDNHSYDVPEILVLPIVDGSQEYLDWITKETTRE